MPVDVRNDEIQLQLERILASSSFKNSRRHTHFLRFVVERFLSGKSAELKERIIAIEVFDRSPDYDATTDAIVTIVRGGAVELRKRIAQYYADPSHANELRLELPLGTYVPIFHRPGQKTGDERDLPPSESGVLKSATESSIPLPNVEDGAQSQESHGKKGILTRPAVIVSGVIFLALIGICLVLYSLAASSNRRELNAFWAPLMSANDSIIVCAGDLNHIVNEHPIENDSWLHFTATRNHLDPNVGTALLNVGNILGSRGRKASLRLADLTELSDLRQQPVIFVGGFNNQWTQRILAGLRFRMVSSQDGSYAMIVDQKNPSIASWRLDFRTP